MTDESKAIEDFLFRTPLYEPVALPREAVSGMIYHPIPIDGYCSECHTMRTFTFTGNTVGIEWWSHYNHDDGHFSGSLNIKCTRHGHPITIYYRMDSGLIKKIGQLPSFADIAIDESKGYSKLLDKEDRAEFHKAIGLAAHGVGIGSYVYLRRIFERLIWRRFNEYKAAEKWKESDFKQLSMKERIELLKDHLPEFLVQNAKLYSILSLGIHELNEADCLAFFPVLRQSTIWILEQDKKKQEELCPRGLAIASHLIPAHDLIEPIVQRPAVIDQQEGVTFASFEAARQEDGVDAALS
jgi:hypothetical protein